MNRLCKSLVVFSSLLMVSLFSFTSRVGAWQENDSKRPDLEKCRKLCKKIESSIEKGDLQKFHALIDTKSIVDKITADIETDPRFVNGFVGGFDALHFFDVFAESVKDGGSLSLIRVKHVGDKTLATFRFLDDEGGLRYADFELADRNEKIKIVDIRNMAHGQFLTEVQRRTFSIGALRFMSDEQKKELSPEQQELLNNHNRFMNYLKACTREKFEEAVRIFPRFPDVLKHDKTVLLGALAATMELGDDSARQNVIDVYKKVYKNDTSWNLFSIDMFIDDQNYDEAIKSVNRLHEEIGDDYLVSHRASIWVEKGDLKKARVDAEKATKLMPNFEQVYWNLLDVVGEQKDFVEYARLLDFLEDKFDYDFGDLKDWEGYDDFIESAEYPKWMKNRR